MGGRNYDEERLLGVICQGSGIWMVKNGREVS